MLEEQYRKLLRLQIDHFDSCMNLGLLLQSLGRLDDALASYRKTLRIKPDDYRVLINIGNVLKNQSLAEQALEAYANAPELNPDAVEAHINISSLLHSEQKFDEAIAYCDGILASHPGHLEAHQVKAASAPVRNISWPTSRCRRWNARNDPFLPGRYLPGTASAKVRLAYPARGGHLGFTAGGFPEKLTWLPEKIVRFLTEDNESELA